jgi:DNA-binding transcriptional LysR family regulator
LLPVFLARYSKVQIVEISTDRMVDIVGEGFDLAIRGHLAPLQDSALVQRAIAKVPWYLFAGAGYVREMGRPSGPEDLARHATVSIVRSGPSQWQLRGPSGEEITVPILTRFQSNDLIMLKEAACANLGIAALPGYICKAELAAGKLVPILPGWMAADARMTALMPYRTGILPAVRALIDFLAAEIPKVTAFDDTSP